MPSPTITIAPGLDINNSRILQLVGDFHLPGEQVTLDLSVKFNGEDASQRQARAAIFGNRILTVLETRVDPEPDGKGFHLRYVFEGLEGRHNAKAFCDPSTDKHVYGVLIRREEQTWFVPLENVGGITVDDVA